MSKGTRVTGRVGRPAKAEKRARWLITIPESIAAPWDLLLNDPKTGKAKNGEKQFLMTELLRLTLAAWKAGDPTINVSHLTSRMSSLLQQENSVDN